MKHALDAHGILTRQDAEQHQIAGMDCHAKARSKV